MLLKQAYSSLYANTCNSGINTISGMNIVSGKYTIPGINNYLYRLWNKYNFFEIN